MSPRAIRCLFAALALLAGVSLATAQDTAPERDPAGDVLNALKRTLTWYQQARTAMHEANETAAGLVVAEDQQALLRVVQRAFDVAKAKATLLARSGSLAAASPSDAGGDDTAARRAKLEASIRAEEREIARLQDSVRRAARARRAGLEAQLVSANRQLALDRLHLQFITSLEQATGSLASGTPDLAHQIQALQDAVPELNAGNAPASKNVVAATPSTSPSASTSPVVHTLLALQRSRNALDLLSQRTQALERDVDRDLDTTEKSVRDLADHLRQLARNPGGNDGAAAPDEAEFRAQLDRVKALADVVVPLRAESALLHRFASDVERWQRGLESETRRVLEELGLQLIGVAVSLLVILAGGMLWRVATMRYISDPYRRRLSLTARNGVVIVAVILVIVFRFTTELTALVTALGFAAAGIAFALQNVILSVAGYFSMVAPNGIRVGDRVSLQGPFGYVHGEVIEIGFVRVRLRELSTDTLQPTGRVVVFPNSVVFTGTFFKLPPAPQPKAA